MQVQKHPQGGFVCTCERCGAKARVRHPQHFVTGHRCTHLGMGDVVARVTKAVGITPCKPCEERRKKLNGWIPSIWRK